MTRFLVRSVACSVLLAAVAAMPALADPGSSDSTGNSDPLGGPAVKDRHAPGARERFGNASPDGKKRMEMPFEMFMGAVRTLGGPDAPDDIRPSDDQMEKVRDVMQDYRSAMEAFRAEHREEIESLMKQAGMEPGAMRERARERVGNRRDGGAEKDGATDQGGDGAAKKAKGFKRNGPEGDGGMDVTPEQRAAREKLRQLREESGPKPDAYRARVWSILTSSQKQYVEHKIEEVRANGGPQGILPPPPPGDEGGQPGFGRRAPGKDAVKKRAAKSSTKGSASDSKGTDGSTPE